MQSPFNITNWKLVVITLTPGIAALLLANRLSQKRKTDKLPQTPSAPELRTNTEAEEVVQRYRRIMVDDATSLGCVADERKLPDSKERIKKALLLFLAEEDDEQAREHLKTGYILLANFQPGVGEENVGIHVTNKDMAGSPESERTKVVTQSDVYEKWQPIVDKEFEELVNDLRKLGYWRD